MNATHTMSPELQSATTNILWVGSIFLFYVLLRDILGKTRRTFRRRSKLRRLELKVASLDSQLDALNSENTRAHNRIDDFQQNLNKLKDHTKWSEIDTLIRTNPTWRSMVEHSLKQPFTPIS